MALFMRQDSPPRVPHSRIAASTLNIADNSFDSDSAPHRNAEASVTNKSTEECPGRTFELPQPGVLGRLKDIYDRLGLKHCIPLIILVVFALVGGAIFYACENRNEIERQLAKAQAINSTREEFMANLSQIIWSLRRRDPAAGSPHKRWTRTIETVEALLLDYEEAQGVGAGIDHQDWTFVGSVFFASTLFTTIGYGNFACVTTGGQLFTMIYALLGIPLVLAILNNLGKLLGQGINKGWKSVRKCAKRSHTFIGHLRQRVSTWKWARKRTATNGTSLTNGGCRPIQYSLIRAEDSPFAPRAASRQAEVQIEESHDKEVDVGEQHDEQDQEAEEQTPVSLAVFLTVSWLFGCAGFFLALETEWSYFRSFYFFFISSTTIGLGDVTMHPGYMILTSPLVIIGLSLVSMLINVIQNRIDEILFGVMQMLKQEYEKRMQEINADESLTPEERERLLQEIWAKQPWWLSHVMTDKQKQQVADQIEVVEEIVAQARALEFSSRYVQVAPTDIPGRLHDVCIQASYKENELLQQSDAKSQVACQTEKPNTVSMATVIDNDLLWNELIDEETQTKPAIPVDVWIAAPFPRPRPTTPQKPPPGRARFYSRQFSIMGGSASTSALSHVRRSIANILTPHSSHNAIVSAPASPLPPERMVHELAVRAESRGEARRPSTVEEGIETDTTDTDLDEPRRRDSRAAIVTKQQSVTAETETDDVTPMTQEAATTMIDDVWGDRIESGDKCSVGVGGELKNTSSVMFQMGSNELTVDGNGRNRRQFKQKSSESSSFSLEPWLFEETVENRMAQTEWTLPADQDYTDIYAAMRKPSRKISKMVLNVAPAPEAPVERAERCSQTDEVQTREMSSNTFKLAVFQPPSRQMAFEFFDVDTQTFSCEIHVLEKEMQTVDSWLRIAKKLNTLQLNRADSLAVMAAPAARNRAVAAQVETINQATKKPAAAPAIAARATVPLDLRRAPSRRLIELKTAERQMRHK